MPVIATLEPPALVLLGVTAVAALVDWVAVARGLLSLELVAKPAVIVALVGVALSADVGDGVAQGLVVAALGASVVGDMVLAVPEGRFEIGLGAFLAAHLLYAPALARDVSVVPSLVGLGVVLVVAVVVGPTLIGAVRRSSPRLVVPVVVYMGALAVTAVLGVGTATVAGAVGGLAFLASDALLGWGRFVGPAPGGRVLVHVTYHVAQTGLVVWLVS